MKKVKSVCLNLFALMLLASCQHVKVPNTEVCTVAGIMAAGASCAMTLSPQTRDLDLDQFIEFLEPQEEIVDSSGKKIPARGGALCQSASDWNKQKTACETLCIKAGSQCTYDMKKTFNEVSENIRILQEHVSR